MVSFGIPYTSTDLSAEVHMTDDRLPLPYQAVHGTYCKKYQYVLTLLPVHHTKPTMMMIHRCLPAAELKSFILNSHKDELRETP